MIHTLIRPSIIQNNEVIDRVLVSLSPRTCRQEVLVWYIPFERRIHHVENICKICAKLQTTKKKQLCMKVLQYMLSSAFGVLITWTPLWLLVMSHEFMEIIQKLKAITKIQHSRDQKYIRWTAMCQSDVNSLLRLPWSGVSWVLSTRTKHYQSIVTGVLP